VSQAVYALIQLTLLAGTRCICHLVGGFPQYSELHPIAVIRLRGWLVLDPSATVDLLRSSHSLRIKPTLRERRVSVSSAIAKWDETRNRMEFARLLQTPARAFVVMSRPLITS